MDSNQRFDQLESLLVDLARKVDQQSEAITKQGAAIERVEHRLTSIEQRLGSIEDQIGDIINIFKLSEARHTQSEQRLDRLATEIQEQGRRTDEALQIQMQMIGLMRAGNTKTEALEQRFESLEGHEPRIKGLEDGAFRSAS